MQRNNRGSAPATRRNGISAVRGLLITALVLISVIGILSVGSYNTTAWDPHIITGTAYEENGSVLSGADVTITNTRTGESSNATSNATGVYGFNLLNLPLGWAVGDTIQVNTTNGTDIAGSNSTQILTGTTSTIIDIWIGTTQVTTGVNFFVIDQNGYPVNSAMINIKDNSGDIVTTKISDSNGKASTTLVDGLYTITISKSGFDDVVKTIRVHGCTFSFRLGEVAEVSVITDLWAWALIFLALILVISLLYYLYKKM